MHYFMISGAAAIFCFTDSLAYSSAISPIPAKQRIDLAPPVEQIQEEIPIDPSAFWEQANRKIAWDLFKAMKTPAEGSGAERVAKDFLISPYVITEALLALYGSCEGATKEQIAKTLGIRRAGKELVSAAAAAEAAAKEVNLMSKGLVYRDEGELIFLNTLWLQRGLTTALDYQTLIVKLHSSIRNVPFLSQPLNSIDTINLWILTNTYGKIINILEKDSVKNTTLFLMTSCAAIIAAWEQPFSLKDSEMAPFFPTPRTTITIPTMHLSGMLPYFEDDELFAILLPYHSSGSIPLALLIVLPRTTHGLAVIEETFSDEKMRYWLNGMTPKNLDITMPITALRYNVNLKPTLQAIGMPMLFSASADFSLFTKKSSPKVVLDALFHQSYLIINEGGSGVYKNDTKPAETSDTGKTAEASPTTSLRINNPFFLALINKQTRVPLFLGRIANPK